jgi:hypothetical protein
MSYKRKTRMDGYIDAMLLFSLTPAYVGKRLPATSSAKLYTDNKVVDPDPPKRHIFGAFPSIKIHTMLLLLLLSLVASIQ